MTGALTNSYADIFSVIIVNYDQPNISDWNWNIGSPFGEDNQPIRSLNNPSIYNQPEHMSQYVLISEDYGGIHINSGIHNKAAYKLITTLDSDGEYLFDCTTIAYLFYLTLTRRLKSNSTFYSSRIELLATAAKMFRNNHQKRQIVLQAINNAFNSVGIMS